MLAKLPKILALGAMAIAAVVSLYFMSQVMHAYHEFNTAMEEAQNEKARELASKKSDNTVPIVSLPEVFANVNSGTGENRKMHMLGVKLDIELFEEENRPLLESRVAGVKNAIITTALEQDVEWLDTMAGKLYFKETIVARMNEFFQTAVVRDVHFTSFYMQ